jgi:hypothetical protein
MRWFIYHYTGAEIDLYISLFNVTHVEISSYIIIHVFIDLLLQWTDNTPDELYTRRNRSRDTTLTLFFRVIYTVFPIYLRPLRDTTLTLFFFELSTLSFPIYLRRVLHGLLLCLLLCHISLYVLLKHWFHWVIFIANIHILLWIYCCFDIQGHALGPVSYGYNHDNYINHQMARALCMFLLF